MSLGQREARAVCGKFRLMTMCNVSMLLFLAYYTYVLRFIFLRVYYVCVYICFLFNIMEYFSGAYIFFVFWIIYILFVFCSFFIFLLLLL